MSERGTSTIELIMVLGLAGLMLAFAGEGFVSAAMRQQGQAVTAEVAAELRTARHLSMMRHERIRVRVESGLGMLVTERADVPGPPLRHYDFRKTGVVVERMSNGSSVLFYPSGRSASPTTITLSQSHREQRQVTVSLVGRVSIQ